MNIVDYIPIGYENAITSESLKKITGLDSRDIRRLVSRARRDYPICNFQDGKGYFIADNREIAFRQLKQETARARSIFWSVKGLRDYINTIPKEI